MYRKLKAFTLLELLVAMAITGLVVSIAGISYNILGKQYYIFKENNTIIAAAFSLNNKLAGDFIEAVSITRQGNELVVKKDGRPEVKYLVNSDRIIRTEAVSDTFFISARNIKSGFINEEKVNGLVDELYFEAKVLGENECFHFKKAYSADALLNIKEIWSGN